VGRLRSLRKFLFALSLSFGALLFLTLLTSQIEQHLFRRRAELLLSQLQSLELRKTSWQDAQTQFQSWGANREFDKGCSSQKCSLKITLNEFVLGHLTQRNLFEKLDDYFRWRLKLSYSEGPFVHAEFWLIRLYMCMGGRPARVIANIGMRDGTVWSKGTSVWVETLIDSAEWSGDQPFEFSLIAEVNSAPRFDYYGSPRVSSQLMLHQNYVIGRPGGCEVCVEGWVKFTPYAAPEDVHRLMQLDLSCLTRWHPCVSQNEIMPAAWAQYVAERSRTSQSKEILSCSPAIIEILGRDSANIATAEVVRYHENFYSQGYDKIVATVRVLDRLKGMAAWNVGETRDVTLPSGTPCADDKVQVGSRLILYGGWDRSNEVRFDPQKPWPVIPMNDTNLNFFRRGIDQDFSAQDKTE
jgi:hypothetical protein